MQIIAFPFAGGNKYSYNNFFSSTCNISIQEYPGRGARRKDNLIENIDELINDLFSRILDQFDFEEDYVVYGHSMGALVGYLICQKIEKMNLKKPAKLIVCGAEPPNVFVQEEISNLDDMDFWNEVSKLGGIQDDLTNHPELIEFFTPILRSDFKCIEKYEYDNSSPQLTIPIDVFYGSEEDLEVREADAWRKETTANVDITELKGDHFFIFDHLDFFNEYFKSLQINATI